MTRPLFPALLALALASCPGCTANQCLPGEVAVTHSSFVPEAVSSLPGVPRRGVYAVSIGRHIFIHPDAANDTALLAHEMEHVRQWERDGLRFSVGYLWQSLLYGYRLNPYEVAADSAARMGGGTD